MPIHFGSLIEVHLHKSRNHINSWSKSAMRLPLICVYHLISKWETFNVVEIDKKKSLAWNLISKTRIHSLNRATIRAGFVRFSLAHKLMPFMRIETSFFNYLNAKNNQIYIKWISFFWYSSEWDKIYFMEVSSMLEYILKKKCDRKFQNGKIFIAWTRKSSVIKVSISCTIRFFFLYSFCTK